MAWLKLKATSQVEVSHLLFSEAHRPCLRPFRSEIRGFLISIWDTYVCLSSQLQSLRMRWNQKMQCSRAVVYAVLYMFTEITTMHSHLFMWACCEHRACEGNESAWLLEGKPLKRLEPGTPSWSHFRFHVSSCPGPKWPITIISLLVLVMLVR